MHLRLSLRSRRCALPMPVALLEDAYWFCNTVKATRQLLQVPPCMPMRCTPRSCCTFTTRVLFHSRDNKHSATELTPKEKEDWQVLQVPACGCVKLLYVHNTRSISLAISRFRLNLLKTPHTSFIKTTMQLLQVPACRCVVWAIAAAPLRHSFRCLRVHDTPSCTPFLSINRVN